MIQIDMEMPKCCDECFALDDHGDYPYCLISQDQRGYTFNVRENRMPSCPLKAQEPRVMTLEEVGQFVYGSPYIIETNLPGCVPRLTWGLYSHQGVSGNFDFAITDGRKRLFDADYGKTWRCWTSRPTDEQREATPWN